MNPADLHIMQYAYQLCNFGFNNFDYLCSSASSSCAICTGYIILIDVLGHIPHSCSKFCSGASDLLVLVSSNLSQINFRKIRSLQQGVQTMLSTEGCDLQGEIYSVTSSSRRPNLNEPGCNAYLFFVVQIDRTFSSGHYGSRARPSIASRNFLSSLSLTTP